MKPPAQPDDDLHEMRALLTADVEHVAEALFGLANKALSTKKTLRFGTNGSLAIELRGRKRGEWFSHETGVGGGVFDLIAFAHGTRFAEAVRWGRTWLGTAGGDVDAPRLRPHPIPTQAAYDAEQAAQDARAIESARQMAHAAVPIAGTVAEIYLVATRGIPRPAAWPDAIRYHAATRSLLAIATLADGTVRAVQRVRLTRSAQKAEGTSDKPVKATNGRQEGALVRLPVRPDVVPALASTLLLAEGPENGLSVWAATGAETWFAFGVGMFHKAELPTGRRVILCRDDDRNHSQADKAVRKALTVWRQAGVDAVVAKPWPERRQDKSDFNDLIEQQGAAGVLARLVPLAPVPSKPVSKRVSVEAARVKVDDVVKKFFDSASAFDPDIAKAEGALPPVHGVKVGVGIGKSHAARQHAVDMLIALRSKGSRRNVALAVPTHRLGSEQAEMLQALPTVQAAGLTVATWRGRAAPNPEHPDYLDASIPDNEKAAMCRNLDAVFDAQAYVLNVQESACRRTVKSGGDEKVVHECPLFSSCAYQEQMKRKADLWIVPHEMLFNEKPKALGDLAALVVDESAWRDGLEGIEGHPVRLSLDALKGGDRRSHETRSPDWLTLQHHRTRALDALENMTDGPIIREAIAAEGLTDLDAADAHSMEYGRLVDPKIHPGMTKGQRTAALVAAEGNRTVLKAAKFWKAMKTLLADGSPGASGWAELATIETQEGPARVIRLRGRKPVREGWQVPTLLIDALLDLDLVRPFWPQVQLTADVQAKAPHQRVRQVIDRSYSKGRLDPLSDEKAAADPTEARRRLRNLREARAIICREARRHNSGRVLVVAQKGVREAMTAMGPLPRNLVLAHHNAVAGRDEWGDVAGLVVLGRTAPSPAGVEQIAMALTGAALPPQSGWYQKAPAARELAEGASMPAETDVHPDRVAEAIRWQICNGELEQIIGRGRGVNRTAANPLDVLVLTDCPLPLPIHEAVAANDLEPSCADLMLAETGFLFETPRHAAAACPALWPSWEAAKKALDRETAKTGKKGTNPYKNLPIGVCPLLPPTLRRVDYRRKGQGQNDATGWFDPLMVADPEAALAKLLGPLAWCQVEGQPAIGHSSAGRGHAANATPTQKAAEPPAPPVDRPALQAVPSGLDDVPAPLPQPRQSPLLLLFVGRPIHTQLVGTPQASANVPPPIGPP